MTRRKWLIFAGTGLLGLVGLRLAVPWIMRARGTRTLSDEAAAFVEQCFSGIDRSRIWDAHVHIVGLGAGGTGCSVNPEMLSPLHPVKRFQFDVYRTAIGMGDRATADADYVERLLSIQQQANPRGKLVVLAFDRHVTPEGDEVPERSPFYTPNDYVLRLAAEHEPFVAGASIHPYRKDAVERLDAAVEGGARAVKWLPNAMGIDPSSPLCDRFYRRLAELGIPLITHGGKEYAVHAGVQGLGNPLLLRRALEAGVRVVVAHCASLGRFPDFDLPEAGRPTVDSFELLLRLMREDAWRDRLFADISTLGHVHHDFEPLRRLLLASDLHERLIYASDYPMPALRFMISPRRLQLAGLLTARKRRLCAELFEYNPLLFDFAVARSFELAENGKTYRFPPSVFETDRLFELSRPTGGAPVNA